MFNILTSDYFGVGFWVYNPPNERELGPHEFLLEERAQ
jgi:hypothetical protein